MMMVIVMMVELALDGNAKASRSQVRRATEGDVNPSAGCADGLV